MQRASFDGTWWLPNDPARRVAGTIDLNQEGLTLTAYGSWEDAQLVGIDEATGKYVPHLYPAVYGIRHSDGEAVTLTNVRGGQIQLPWDSFEAKTFAVEVAFVGERPDSRGFAKISVDLDLLSAWSVPPSRHLAGDSSETRQMLRLNTDNIDLLKVGLLDGAVLTLRSGLEGVESISLVELREYCAIDVAFPRPVSWGAVLEYFLQSRNFLTLCLGMPVRVGRAYVHNSGSESGALAYYHPEEPLSDDETSDAALRDSVLRYTSPALLTAKHAAGVALQSDLGSVLTRWFAEYDRFGSVHELLMSRYTSPDMLPMHRYAALFGGIEELHKALDLGSTVESRTSLQVRRDRVKSALRNARFCSFSLARFTSDDLAWLEGLIANSRNDRSIAQKVGDILDLTGAVGRAILRARPSFTRDAARARGRISHGSDNSEQRNLDRLALELALEFAVRTLLISELLDVAEREPFQVAASDRNHFKNILSYLRSSASNL